MSRLSPTSRRSLTPARAEKAPTPRLAYTATGVGPPLVLLHGLSGSGRWWGRNAPVFAASFRTYAVDLPGFGESRRVRWSRLDDIADELAAWFGDKGLPVASVAGHSLGAAVAARLAARHPWRVDKLILVNAAIRPRGVRANVRPGDLVRLMTRRTAQDYVPFLTQDALRSHPLSFLAASRDALQSDWEPDLTRIVAPTLVVWGERDPITPLALGHRIVATIPDARLVTLPDAGHSPMWEDPETFNAAVLRFLG
jgi:pimeloyl-ACP methyl ester carboxylesterase